MTTPTLPRRTAERADLAELIAGVRGAVAAHRDWSATAELVAGQLRRHLPSPDVLTAEERAGSPEQYQSHTLYVAPDGAFSILAVVWRPGQLTRIHDHVTWCVVGVIQGTEHEELFDEQLNLIGVNDNAVGDVSGFAPPGDIHRVHNTHDTTAISVHIYGTDVTRIGSSVRRFYN
jgi:predicted metal-dependent enzyme (double-stranded beta helix superfamily)